MKKKKEIKFEIKEKIGVFPSTVRELKDGVKWQKEVNIISWNGLTDKIDIREWRNDYEKMNRGITLTEIEARELMEILEEYFGK